MNFANRTVGKSNIFSNFNKTENLYLMNFANRNRGKVIFL